jgi:hypothetical protein
MRLFLGPLDLEQFDESKVRSLHFKRKKLIVKKIKKISLHFLCRETR